MHHTKYLTRLGERLKLYFRAMGKGAIVPVVIVLVVLPVLTLIAATNPSNMKDNASMLRLEITILSYLFLPFFAAWWPIFALKNYIEGDGRELLWVFQSSSIFFDAAVLIFLYQLLTTLYFLVLHILLKEMLFLLLRLLIINFFVAALALVSIKVLRSTALSFMLILLYIFVNYMLSGNVGTFPLYYHLQLAADAASLRLFLPHLISGVGLFGLAVVLPERSTG